MGKRLTIILDNGETFFVKTSATFTQIKDWFLKYYGKKVENIIYTNKLFGNPE